MYFLSVEFFFDFFYIVYFLIIGERVRYIFMYDLIFMLFKIFMKFFMNLNFYL